jgi:hypothetical protein
MPGWTAPCNLLCRYTKPFQPYKDFDQQACAFDVVAIATFPEHHLDMANALAGRACPSQRFVLVVHNPHGLESSGELLGKYPVLPQGFRCRLDCTSITGYLLS